MSIRIIPKENQGYGAFNGGEIVENKPIGFPQDHSSIRPYSSLFYWAHAKAVTDSTIGLHPHQGFEICSFVLNGEIRHYDTKLKEWRPLSKGDVQIIRAGNGISHSEWMGKDAEMFQIWFDPDLRKTMPKPASYNDYRDAEFPQKTEGIARIKTLVGPGSLFEMDTPGVEVLRILLEAGSFHLPVPEGKIASLYLLSGATTLNGSALNPSDFVIADQVEALDFQSDVPSDIFVILSPAHVGYHTYGQLMAAR